MAQAFLSLDAYAPMSKQSNKQNILFNMAVLSKPKRKDLDLESISGEVAIGATRVAIVAGIIAIGAAMLSNDKTREKVGQETKGFFDNLKTAINLFKTAQEKTAEFTKQLKS